MCPFSRHLVHFWPMLSIVFKLGNPKIERGMSWPWSTWLSTLVNRIYDFEGCLSDCTKNFYSFNAVAVLIGVLKRYAWFIKYFPSWINTKQRWYVFSLIKKNRFAQITDTFVHQMFETQETVTMHVYNTHVFNQA
jgi:hypothetical protein